MIVWRWMATGLALGVCSIGCRGTGSVRLGESTHGEAEVGGAVVSTVDGHPITLSRVEQLVRRGLSPEGAVERLQVERLLLSEAERRGHAGGSEAGGEQHRALVQSLLRREVESVTASESELREAYEAATERFSRPETRTSFHVLARVEESASAQRDAAARAFVARVIAELRAGRGYEELRERYHESREHGDFEVLVEQLPAIDAQAAFVQPFLDALFAPARAGVIDRPVRTRFGWHAIEVTEIDPPRDVPFEEARAELLPEIEERKRRERLDALLGALRAATPVQVPEGVAALLAQVEP